MSINMNHLDNINYPHFIYKKKNDFRTFDEGEPAKGYKKLSSSKMVDFFSNYVNKNNTQISKVEQNKIRQYIEPIAGSSIASQTNKIKRFVQNFFSRFKNLLTGKGFHSSIHLQQQTKAKAESILKNLVAYESQSKAELEKVRAKIAKLNEEKQTELSKYNNLKEILDNFEGSRDSDEYSRLEQEAQKFEDVLTIFDNKLKHLNKRKEALEKRLGIPADDSGAVGGADSPNAEEPDLQSPSGIAATAVENDEGKKADTPVAGEDTKAGNDESEDKNVKTSPASTSNEEIKEEIPLPTLERISANLKEEQKELFQYYLELSNSLPFASKEIEALTSIVKQKQAEGELLVDELKALLKVMTFNYASAEQNAILERFFAVEWDSEFYEEFFFNFNGILMAVSQFVSNTEESNLHPLLRKQKSLENTATKKQEESNTSWWAWTTNGISSLFSGDSSPTGLTNNLQELMKDRFGTFNEGPQMVFHLEMYLQNILIKARQDKTKEKFIKAFVTYGENLRKSSKKPSNQSQIAQRFREGFTQLKIDL